MQDTFAASLNVFSREISVIYRLHHEENRDKYKHTVKNIEIRITEWNKSERDKLSLIFYLLCGPLVGGAVMAKSLIDAADGAVDEEKSNTLSYWTTYSSIDTHSSRAMYWSIPFTN